MRSVFLAAVATGALANIGNRESMLYQVDRWCGDDSDCRKYGDAAATCEAPLGLGCKCSEGYGSRMVGGVSIPKCFPEEEEMLVNMVWTSGRECSAVGNYAYGFHRVETSAVLGALSSVFGRTSQYVAQCPEAGKLTKYATALVHVEKRALKAVQETVQKQGANRRTVEAQLRFMLVAALRRNQNDTASAALRDLGFDLHDTLTNVVTDTTTKAAACSGVDAKELKAGLNFRELLPSGTSWQRCAHAQCQPKFLREPVRFGWHACKPVPGLLVNGTACFVDGDCSYNARDTVCQTGVCVPPPTTKSVAYPVTGLPKHWCTQSSDCRAHGGNATCSVHKDLGNWCDCNGDFDYPTPLLPLCLPAAAQATSVALGFTLSFGQQLDCDALKAPVRALVESVLGPVAAFQAVCPHARVAQASSFIGVAEVNLAFVELLTNLGGTKEANRLLAIFHSRLVAAQGHSAEVQQQQVWIPLPTGVSLGNPVGCEASHATYARTDSLGRCQPLQCEDGYVLKHDAEGQWACEKAPVQLAQSVDDDLSTGEIAAIATACVVVVIIIAGVIAFLVRRGPTPANGPAECDEKASETEMA